MATSPASHAGRRLLRSLSAIDAVDLWHARAFDTVLLVTSDGDFRHLATWLRERGARVVGMGEAKAPEGFRAACSDFHDLIVAPSMAPADFDARVHEVVARSRPDGIRVADLNVSMHRAEGFRISDSPEGNWRGWLANRPALFALDPKHADARVRTVPAGRMRDPNLPCASNSLARTRPAV